MEKEPSYERMSIYRDRKRHKKYNALEIRSVNYLDSLNNFNPIIKVHNRNIDHFMRTDPVNYFGVQYSKKSTCIIGTDGALKNAKALYVPIPCKLGNKPISIDEICDLINIFDRAKHLRLQLNYEFTEEKYECAMKILTCRRWEKVKVIGNNSWRTHIYRLPQVSRFFAATVSNRIH
uniref:RNase H domain-containing protein n=1 Tax=Parastrongyloides trichosuri TaxID=131310 RepID=A0A0N4ZHG3_PARTI